MHNKPPLGLKPKSIHDYERIREIVSALERYAKADIAPPTEWIDELKELLKIS